MSPGIKTVTDLIGKVVLAEAFKLRPSMSVVHQLVLDSPYGGDKIFLSLGTEGLSLVRSDDGYLGQIQIPMAEILKLAAQADPRFVLDTTPPGKPTTTNNPGQN